MTAVPAASTASSLCGVVCETGAAGSGVRRDSEETSSEGYEPVAWSWLIA